MNMKNNKFAFLIIFAILTGGCNSVNKITDKDGEIFYRENVSGNIISRDYNYEKLLFNTHNFEFKMHLENINGFEKASNLVTKLIYEDKKFDDYAQYMEDEFTKYSREEDYPPITLDDGTQYFYRSALNIDYSIEYIGDSFAIIKYSEYFYYSGTAHGYYRIFYHTIDINEGRLLEISDLINPVPDALLKQLIESEYDIAYYLREEIWKPDSINFNSENTELIWNIYQITAYADGIIIIEIPDDIIMQYLTERGKALKMETDNFLRQKAASH